MRQSYMDCSGKYWKNLEQKSMFGLLFNQKNREKRRHAQIAAQLYGQALTQTRRETFYTEYGVPDSFDGRFDLLLVHVFIILHNLMGDDAYEDLSQALFDATFKDMDQTLREMGIGDMGVPKHMKRMMKAFNGRMHSYQLAMSPDSVPPDVLPEGVVHGSMEEALRRNLYGTVENGEEQLASDIAKMIGYVQSSVEKADVEDIKQGRLDYAAP